MLKSLKGGSNVIINNAKAIKKESQSPVPVKNDIINSEDIQHTIKGFVLLKLLKWSSNVIINNVKAKKKESQSPVPAKKGSEPAKLNSSRIRPLLTSKNPVINIDNPEKINK